MKQSSIRLSSVYPLLILIPLLSACQSYPQPAVEPPEENVRHPVQQAGSSVANLDENGINEEHVADDEEPSDRPSLLGFAIGDPMPTVAAEYGKAQAQYTMEDGTEVIVVHNYQGFIVGFNEQSTIHFIDVYSPDVDPQLFGIRIGSSVEEALQALGEPQHQTGAVMMYEQNNSILKLDIDHTTMDIVSIKLFASANP